LNIPIIARPNVPYGIPRAVAPATTVGLSKDSIVSPGEINAVFGSGHPRPGLAGGSCSRRFSLTGSTLTYEVDPDFLE